MESESIQPSIISDGMEDDLTSPSSVPSPSGGSSMEDVQMSDKEPSPEQGAHRNCDKYNLRRSSVRVRVQTEQSKQQPKQRKCKSRPPPLSKYRRRTANARERSRMAEINDAFEELKEALPQNDLEAAVDQVCENSNSINSSSSSSNSRGNNNSKTKTQPTKAAVLRLAINYIAALRDILGYSVDSGSSSNSSSSSGSSCGGRKSGEAGDTLSDDLGSDAASSITPSTSSGSGDEESLMSSDLDPSGLTSDMDAGDLASGMESIVMGDLDFFDSSLAADFSPDLSPDFTATLSPEEEMCLELVTSVL